MCEKNASDRRRHPRHFISGLAEVGAYRGKLVDLSISGFQAVVNGEPEKERVYSCQLILAEIGSQRHPFQGDTYRVTEAPDRR